MTDNIKEISVKDIVINRFNPRRTFDLEYIKELAASIKRDGQWDPIIVKQGNNGKYNLISGECRLRAVKRIGLSTIKGRILSIDRDEAYLLALKANLVRRNLNPIEEAYGIEKLINQGWSRKKIATNLNKSQAWISLRLKLAKRAGKGLQNAVIAEIVTPTCAVKIAELPKSLQGPTVEKVVRDRLNLQEVEKLVNLLKATNVPKKLERIFKMSRAELIAIGNTSNKEKIEVDGNIAVAMECKCGTKYIADWMKKQIVSMEEFNGH